jgi:glyoxylase-like metal-dependent hydrolase (beta-lactamase superfamily II)
MTLAVEQIEPGVIRLRLRSWQGTLTGYEASAYVVRGVLVDTGFRRVKRELLSAIDAIAPRGAIVTHWHEDHAGNAPALAARGLPLHMHERCEATLRARPSIRGYRHLVWGATPRLDVSLVAFDPAPLQVLALPGHTADHLVVWDAERRILVSGDLFLGVKVRVAHASESPRQLLTSLRTAAALSPRLMLDAHRGVIDNPARLLAAKIDWMEHTIGSIVELRERGASDHEIRQRVLGREAFVGWMSRGEYSKLALVRAVLREEGALA